MPASRWLRAAAAMLVVVCLAAPARASAVVESARRLSRFDILPAGSLRDLRAGAPITRAEFATMVAAAAGLGNQIRTLFGVSPFADMVGHPAAGFVAAVYDAGYMTGYPDHTFHPDGPISYAEVVTVLSRMTGLEPDPNQPWPDNYLDVAVDRGIVPRGMELTPYARAPAVRGVVFVLLDQALLAVRDTAGRNLYQRVHDPNPPVLTVDPVPAVVTESEITITGTAADVTRVRVGTNWTELDAEGRFSARVTLAVGLNGVMVEAEDEVGNRAARLLTITRESTGESPEGAQ